VKILLIALALVACQKDDKPKSDPWLGSADTSGPPSLAERHRRADEICPKVTSPWFYRVEKAGHVSYLLGTRHIGVALAKFPQVVRDRVHDAKLAVFEVDPADAFKLPKGGHDLPAEIGADTWKHYTELVGPAVASTVAHERPAMALISAGAMFEDATFLEREIQAELAPLHTPMRGLETKRFQNDLIDKLLDARLFRAMIAQTKDRSEIERDSRKGLTRYCTGIDKSTELSDEDRARMHAAGYTDADLDAYEDALIYSRNTNWIPALEALFTEGGAFVAVGAGHVRGSKGLAELLRTRGWTVTRISE